MADRKKLKYSRTSAGLTPSSKQNSVSSDVSEGKPGSVNSEETMIPPGYTKVDGTLPYNIMCVISGGPVRERTFLCELEKKRSFKSLEVIFISSDKKSGGLTPKMMKKEYDKICKDGVLKGPGREIRLEEIDSIYMLTDVDHYEDELKEIIFEDDTSHTRPIWIISNPDFEIWIYYCFRNNPEVDLKDVIDATPSERSSMIKTVNGRFNNGGGLDTRKAFENLPAGIEHSKKHYAEHNGIPDFLSTQMHIFAEDILTKLGNEYENRMKSKMEFRERMKETRQ